MISNLINPLSSVLDASTGDINDKLVDVISEIARLEAKTKRTESEEQELTDLRSELESLRQQQEGVNRSTGALDSVNGLLPVAGQLGSQILQDARTAEEGAFAGALKGGALGLQIGGPLGGVIGGFGGFTVGQLIGDSIQNDASNVDTTDIRNAEFNRVLKDGGAVGSIVDDSVAFIPIQAEEFEGQKEILTDGKKLYETHSDKSHEEMGEKEVTDFVEPGTYVLTARKKLTQADIDYVYSFGADMYNEDGKNYKVKEMTLASEWKVKEGDSIAKAAEKIKKKARLYKENEDWDPTDRITNQENLDTRTDAISALIMINESKLSKNKLPKNEILPTGGIFLEGGLAGLGSILGEDPFGDPIKGSNFDNTDTPLGSLSEAEVRAVQERLIRDGFGPVSASGEPDGKWGPLTNAAYQKSISLVKPAPSVGGITSTRPLPVPGAFVEEPILRASTDDLTRPERGSLRELSPIGELDKRFTPDNLRSTFLGELDSNLAVQRERSNQAELRDRGLLRNANITAGAQSAIQGLGLLGQDTVREPELIIPGKLPTLTPQQINTVASAATTNSADQIKQIGSGQISDASVAAQSRQVGRGTQLAKDIGAQLVGLNNKTEQANAAADVAAANANTKATVLADDETKSNRNQVLRDGANILSNFVGRKFQNKVNFFDRQQSRENNLAGLETNVMDMKQKLIASGMAFENANEFLIEQLMEARNITRQQAEELYDALTNKTITKR